MRILLYSMSSLLPSSPLVYSRKRKEPSSASSLSLSTTTTINNGEDGDEESSKPAAVDSLSRVAATATTTTTTSSAAQRTSSSTTTAGRGSITGWVSCPLCSQITSKKKYAIGRGLAGHLRDIHTPWNPSKLAQKIHRRKYEKRARQQQKQQHRKRQRPNEEGEEKDNDNDNDKSLISSTTQEEEKVDVFEPLKSWDPSEEEQTSWNLKMVEILKQVETKQKSTITKSGASSSVGTDRNGQQATSYKDSLPPFLKAASEGNLIQLKQLVNLAKEKDMEETEDNNTQASHLLGLLNTTDRHKSTAEHWAAGGGHVECLQFLDNLQSELGTSSHTSNDNKKSRRRDGKTCLHYAARNGHITCIQYLLKDKPSGCHAVDERSGEGTTPLHLACYGGQYETVKYLIEESGANVHAKNDWGCSVAHWIAMTISKSESDIRRLCSYLKAQNVSFVEVQGQGHTVLHKAAQRGNRHIIQWMADSQDDNGGAGLTTSQKELAGAPDLGGHKPSDIWKSMAGDDDFASWMKTEMGW